MGGCLARGDAEATKVLVVALDGVTWDIALPLMEQGRMPNLSRLVDGGFSSHLRTDPPPSLSPIIWTSVATGKKKKDHGIYHFILPHPETGKTIPYTSNMRRVKAFWNILSDRDRSCGVVGWWITWPAEKVNGVMVTSYSAVQFAERLWKGTILKDFDRQTYPPEFMDVVTPIIETCEVEVSERLRRGIFGKVEFDELNEMQKTVVDDTRQVFLSDEIYARTALNLLENRKDLDVVAVYLSGTDVASHRFWKYHEPQGLPEFRSSDREREMLGGVIDDYYTYVDEMIGRFLLADPKRTVILLSDHGFHAETKRGMSQDERSGGHERKDLPGVLVVYGKDVVRDRRIGRLDSAEPPSIYDILPTLLFLQGLPVARDMPGRVLKEAFDPALLARQPIESIATYETGDRGTFDEIPEATDLDDAFKARLEALGYIQGGEPLPAENPEKPAGNREKKEGR